MVMYELYYIYIYIIQARLFIKNILK